MFTTFQEIFRYYTRRDVYPEIVDFLKNRWAAIEATSSNERIFIRYVHRGGPPLRISSKDDIIKYLMRYRGLKPRTFYGSINLYKRLNSKADLDDLSNIIFTTPIIDVDLDLKELELGRNVVREIIQKIEKYGVDKSLYIKFSGRGFHIHIHEKSISQELREKYHPLDIAYSIVEFILRESINDIKPFLDKSESLERPLKVENKIDIQRVFTSPLSLHRIMDYSNICFKPDELDNFDLSWAQPDSPRHDPSWREFMEGEADDLAERAMKEVGGYRLKYIKGEKSIVISSKKKDEKKYIPIRTGRIGRFQVMALLQAARYYILKGDLEKAKSFGLNRAIFYAWAKYHKPKYGVSKYGMMRRQLCITPEEIPHEMIGDEMAFITDEGWFIIGDQVQKPQDYDRQIKSKVESVVPYDIAWRTALEYLNNFPRNTLEKQQSFFKEVYEPVRDRFLELVKKYLREGRLS